MSTRESIGDRLQVIVRVWTDALTYAVVVAVLATVVSMVLGITTGGSLVRGNLLLFVSGWGILAYATWLLWPTSPSDVGGSGGSDSSDRSRLFGGSSSGGGTGGSATGGRQTDDTSSDSIPSYAKSRPKKVRQRLHDRSGESMPARHDVTTFQAIVQSIPPNRWVRPPHPEHRMTLGGKLFLSGLLTLLFSFLLETVFGIA